MVFVPTKCILHCRKYLEEPFGVLVVRQLEVEELRPATEWVTVGSIGETPANGPVGDCADEGIQHVLDQDVDCVLGPGGEGFNYWS